MPYQRNTVSNRQLAEKHEDLVLVHQAEGECELEPGEGEVGSWRGRQKSAPSSRRQLQAGGGETPAETPSTEESGFISQVHHWIKNP